MERRTGDLAGDSECVVERPGYLQGYLDRRPGWELPAELDQIGHGDSVRRIASDPEGAIGPPPSADGKDRSVAEQRRLGQRSFKVGDEVGVGRSRSPKRAQLDGATLGPEARESSLGTYVGDDRDQTVAGDDLGEGLRVEGVERHGGLVSRSAAR